MAMNVSQVAQRRGITVEQVELLRSQRGLTEAGIERLPERALKRAFGAGLSGFASRAPTVSPGAVAG